MTATVSPAEGPALEEAGDEEGPDEAGGPEEGISAGRISQAIKRRP